MLSEPWGRFKEASVSSEWVHWNFGGATRRPTAINAETTHSQTNHQRRKQRKRIKQTLMIYLIFVFTFISEEKQFFFSLSNSYFCARDKFVGRKYFSKAIKWNVTPLFGPTQRKQDNIVVIDRKSAEIKLTFHSLSLCVIIHNSKSFASAPVTLSALHCCRQ